MKEKEGKSQLRAYAAELKKKVGTLTEELSKMRCIEEDKHKALKSLEETLLKTETQRLQQQTMEVMSVMEYIT